MNNQLYIDTDNGRIYLNYEQERSLRNQISIMNAWNLLESIGCLNPEVLTDDDLVDLAERLDNMYFDNVGECEVQVVEMFNEDYDKVLKFENDEEDDYEEFVDDYYNLAVEQLGELGLDYTAYEYYRDCIEDLYHKDKISAKNGDVGYKTFADILEDARKTSKN